MTEQFKEQLKQAGVNVAGAMNRFMNNEKLYEKFLRKFPADQSYSSIFQALEANDMPEAFRAAHTLKGVAGNLGFDNLLTYVVPLTAALHQDEPEAPEDMLAGTKEEYEKICAVISSNE